MQPFAKWTLHVIGKEFHLVSNFTVLTHQHIWHILHYMVIDQWSGFHPSALTRPRKAPARSIHSSTDENQYGFSQTVSHPSTNAANCCLSSIVVTLAFYHSAIEKIPWKNFIILFSKNGAGDTRLQGLGPLPHPSSLVPLFPWSPPQEFVLKFAEYFSSYIYP